MRRLLHEKMLSIAVVGANGKAGRLIVKEALSRGFSVTAIVRGENQSGASQSIQKDVMDLTKEDLQGFDVVVDALGFWTPETLPLHTVTVKYLADLLSGTKTRLLIVGGAGSLYMDAAHTHQLADEPTFPKEYFPVADAMRKQLEAIVTHKDVNWTYVSPAAMFVPDAPRTGKYVLGGSDFSVNEKGESMVSYADFALALVDEIEKNAHNQEQISVRS